MNLLIAFSCSSFTFANYSIFQTALLIDHGSEAVLLFGCALRLTHRVGVNRALLPVGFLDIELAPLRDFLL